MGKERILIVDDEEAIREILAEFCRSLDYEAVIAASGEEALEKFKPDAFDCVISDISMPGMNGIELLKNIKTIDKRVVFLIITGYPSIESAVEAMKLGAYDYITKPFNMEDMQLKIERALYTRSLENSLRSVNTRMKRLIFLAPILVVLAILFGMMWKH